MIESPLVSVVIVCYNHSQFVVECLNSLKSQTYKNWELIIADDKSKDNSVEVIEDWLGNNNIEAKKIFHNNNKGLCKTLNECIDLAKGEYIKTIAADDIMCPKLLERLMIKFQSLPDDYRLVYSNARFIDEKGDLGEALFPENYDFNREDIEQILFQGNIIIAPTIMFKSKVFKEIGKYNSNFIIEDYEFSLRLVKKYKVDFINEVLAYYRQHSSNISKKIAIDIESVRLKIYHDKEARYARIIAHNIADLYKQGKISKELLKDYKKYIGRKNILYWFIRLRLPYKLYEIKNKIMYKK